MAYTSDIICLEIAFLWSSSVSLEAMISSELLFTIHFEGTQTSIDHSTSDTGVVVIDKDIFEKDNGEYNVPGT